jgi:hypothetical protein
MTDAEVLYIADAIKQLALRPEQWLGLYQYSSHTNEYHPLQENQTLRNQLTNWFNLEID